MRFPRQFRAFRFRAFLASGICVLASRGSAQDPATTRVNKEFAEVARNVADSLGVSHVVAKALAPVRVSDNVIALDVPLPDGPARILLKPNSVRSPNYHLVVQEADGSYVQHDPGVERTYRGFVEGIEGSAVAASIENGMVRALVLLPGRDRIWIEPAPSAAAAGAQGLHAIYDDSAVPAGGRCGFEKQSADLSDANRTGSIARPDATSPVLSGLPNDTWFAELAIDTDVDFFNRFGSVEATEARIHTIINTLNIQYERDVGIQHVLSQMIIRTAPVDMYLSRSANTLLFEFSDFWFRFQGSVQRDTAHLFTGKSLFGGILGLANFSGICDTREGYGLSGFSKVCNGGDNLGDLCGIDANCPGASCVDGVCQAFACRTDLTAHELGHNWAAPHCSCPGWTMNPLLQSANRFNPDLTVPRILAYRDTVTSCLFQGDELIDLSVNPPSAELGGGNQLRFTAIANFQYGIDKDVTALATWSIDRPEIATIDSTGLLVAGAVNAVEVVTVTTTFTFDGMVQETATFVTIEPAPLAPTADLDNPEKNRYISLVPPPASGATALQITLVSLQRPVPPNIPAFPPFNFSPSEGEVRWVGPPILCTDVPSPNRDYLCALIFCEPYYSDNWGDEVIHITGAEIMPSSIYDVRAIPESCRDAEATCVFTSPPVTIHTQRWGDVTRPFQLRSPDLVSASQPNIFDVTAVIDRVKKLPTSLLKPLAHLWSQDNGVSIDGNVSVFDITSVVDAIKGRSYPFFGPCECPSRAPCPHTDRCGRCVPE